MDMMKERALEFLEEVKETYIDCDCNRYVPIEDWKDEIEYLENLVKKEKL